MAGFSETFGRETNQNPLGYDNSASLFFAWSFITCIAIGWSLFLGLYLTSRPYKSTEKHCQCSLCIRFRKDRLRWTQFLKTRLSSVSYLGQVIVLLCLWLIVARFYVAVRNVQTLTVFDPFEILGVSTTAETLEIRKAFRTLSLKLHPDRNPNKPDAHAKFILINKAYEALTNEEAKENYRKYGNPDGPGAMKIGIGLPQFLLDEKYRLGILLSIFTILLVIIPTSFLVYYNRQKRFAGNGILVETMEYYLSAVKESTRVRNFPELLASAKEIEEAVEFKQSHLDEMQDVTTLVVEYGKRHFRQGHLQCTLRNYYLILVQMQRLHGLLSQVNQTQLTRLLMCSDRVTSAIIELCIFRRWLFTAQAGIEFKRCLVQALEPGSNPLMQLPHFDQERVKHCLKGKKSVRDLRSFMNQPAHERKGVTNLTQEQLEDVEAFLECLPRMKMDVKVVVDEENVIYEGDFVTVAVKLTRENLSPNQISGFCHTPNFPAFVKDNWWILLHEKNTNELLDTKYHKDLSHISIVSLQFWAKQGKRTYVLDAMSAVYAGLDVSTEVTVEVQPASERINKIIVHPEDEKLDMGTSYLNQLIGGVNIVPEEVPSKLPEASSSSTSDSDTDDKE